MPRLSLRRRRADSPAASRRRAGRSVRIIALTESLERRLCLSAAAFLPPVSYAGGVPAVSVATGDLNGDYNEDLALAGPNGIFILAGNGDGTFGSPVQISSDTAASKIVANDLNGDGTLDLIALNPGDGTLTVLLGKGDGTFGAPTTVAAVAGVNSIAFGQFNTNFSDTGGDTGSGSSGGSGGSSGGITPTPIPLPTPGPILTPVPVVTGVVQAADTTASGTPTDPTKPVPDPLPIPDPLPTPIPPVPSFDYYQDIVVAGTGGLAVLTANTDGTFQAPRIVHAGSYQGVAVDDFNEDGNDDLATTTGGSVQVFTGNGDGTFSAPASYAVGPDATAVVTGDFNGDYVDDLAVASPGGGTIEVLFAKTDADGNALGTFAPAVSLALGGTPQTIVAGDLNGDGNTDLAAATSNGAVVLTGNGDGTFAAPATFGAGPVSDLALDDFNGDGYLDLASASSQGTGGVAVQLQSVPDVGVTMSAPSSSAIHNNLTYNITVTNTGQTESDGISLSDYLPNGATLVSATASQGTVQTTDGEIDVDLGNLAGGASATVTVVVRPDQYGLLSNSVTVSSDSPDGSWDNNFAEADTQIVGTSGAELGLTQTATGGETFLPIDRPIVTPIAKVTGTTTATAAGTGTATSGGTAKPISVLAGGAVSSVAASSGSSGTASGGSSAGSSGAANGTGVVEAPPPTEPTVPIGGGGVVVDPIPVDPLPPIWFGGYILVGDNVTYTLTVTNNGPETAAGVVVNDTLPQTTTLVSATSTQGTADTSTVGSVKVAVGDLASGASATITVVVKTTQVGTIDNTAATTSSTADPFTDNNSSTVTRYVTDNVNPPIYEPVAGPIAYTSGGAVYAAGAGTVQTTSASGAGNSAAGGVAATAAPLPTDAVAKSQAPSQISISDLKIVSAKASKKATSNAVFLIRRKGNAKTSATVHFATADGSARAGTDYVPGAGTLTFAPGVKRLKVVIPIKTAAATKVGGNKAFTINLSSATNAAIARSAATGTIVHPAQVSARTAPVHINFQPASAATPTGYLADTGALFGPHAGGLSYGWSSDHTAAAALRSGPTGRVGSTFNVLQSADKWEVALPNGKYQVRVAASGKVNAEGKPVVTAKATAARPFATGTRTITVSDGRLTLTDAAGTADVDIAAVDITRIGKAKK